jgi:hypothetical protein
MHGFNHGFKHGISHQTFPRSLKGPTLSGVDQEITTWCRRTGNDQAARRVVLAPVTHRAPHEPEAAIALPASLKPVLGLDDAPAWIVAAEINVSDWPGFDLRTVPGKPGAYYHGRLPPGLYAALRNLAQRLDDAGKLRRISR